MRAICVVQARMSSTRLPGKTLADVCGEPMLQLLLLRLRRASLIDDLVIATSTDVVDDPIVELGERLGVRVSRGSIDDVLGRFVAAIGEHHGAVVRITADCPLIDPNVVDAVIDGFRVGGVAYCSNVEPRSSPDGLDVEVVDADVLRQLDELPLGAPDREHVTSVIRRHPQRFPRRALPVVDDLADLRWTVDEPDDLEFVRRVVERLDGRRHEAPLPEILAAILREPSLAAFGGHRRA